MDKNDLIVVYGVRFIERNGEYYCNGAFGRFIDLLAQYYRILRLVVPVINAKDSQQINDYKIKSNNVIIEPLPIFNSHISAMKRRFIIKKAIRKYSRNWNTIVYIRHPYPFTKYVYSLAKRNNLPVCLHLVGDPISVISESSKYSGVLKRLALYYANYLDRFIGKIIVNTPTLVNGNGLRRLYNNKFTNVREIRTSTLSCEEIVKDIPTMNKNKIRLLYVGRLRHEKGIVYLLEAIKILQTKLNIFLTIVGGGSVLEELKNVTRQLKIEDRVVFEGHIAFGERLFSIYREHDIFILPSVSEGTPRVLLEAMCNGLAVIATNVGGIPFTIQNRYNGLLIPPKSPSTIADAVIEIVNDDKLRYQLIMNGITYAQKNTIESHVEEVYNFIQENCVSKVFMIK